jgi:hypothetical protein
VKQGTCSDDRCERLRRRGHLWPTKLRRRVLGDLWLTWRMSGGAVNMARDVARQDQSEQDQVLAALERSVVFF